jgi:hypothetical protein
VGTKAHPPSAAIEAWSWITCMRARTIASAAHGSGEFRIVMSENSPTFVPRMVGITPGDS